MSHEFHCTFEKKKKHFLFTLLCHNLAQCQPSIAEVSEQHRAQFTHKLEAVVSREIWTILRLWAAEFCEMARRIWQNFPRETVGPTYNMYTMSEKNLQSSVNNFNKFKRDFTIFGTRYAQGTFYAIITSALCNDWWISKANLTRC